MSKLAELFDAFSQAEGCTLIEPCEDTNYIPGVQRSYRISLGEKFRDKEINIMTWLGETEYSEWLDVTTVVGLVLPGATLPVLENILNRKFSGKFSSQPTEEGAVLIYSSLLSASMVSGLDEIEHEHDVHVNAAALMEMICQQYAQACLGWNNCPWEVVSKQIGKIVDNALDEYFGESEPQQVDDKREYVILPNLQGLWIMLQTDAIKQALRRKNRKPWWR